MTKKKTVGECSVELSKNKENYDSIELQEEIHKGSASEKSYEQEVYETYAKGVKDENIQGCFYIVVLFKRERLLKNVVRQLFFYRQTCPSPEFDQTVYRCDPSQTKIEFVWTVPNNSTCMYLPKMKNELPLDQLELLHMVEAFNSGELDKKAAILHEKDKEKFVLVK